MRNISILIPSSYTLQINNKFLRTYKICMLSRVFATFGVTNVIIYYDKFEPKSKRLGKFIEKILNYSITPPKFKKILFPLDEDLKYVYFCPPIEIKIHQPEKNKIKGILVYKYKETNEYTYFKDDKGNIYKFKVKYPYKFAIIKNKKILNLYPGYWSKYIEKPLDVLLKKLKNKGFLLGTSKYGKYILNVKNRIPRKKDLYIVFGTPFKGLKDIVNTNDLDLMINVVKKQLVDTIRLEEAIFYVLEALNLTNII